ncbi:Glycosyl transferase group 1 [Croceitalea dokdonensis DOKDO 023]|uniref:Glycosyl transferase group 1 n=1 Tax=Croceitalea dokdonensis DOKDO 023 TaxID=1300341 RepID=A0A0P7ASN5_9FLAO|nr:glycosyltransferase [Croceitalea dokdonensis]KPM30955.1 Glycosyl transferase group 1 [Croceitalea dokdonensis DOKDO 023]
MRILIVHNQYKQYGGEDTVVQQELLAYKELGYTVAMYQQTNADLGFIDLVLSPFNIMSAIRFRRIVRDFKPDVIHIHNLIFKISPSILWFNTKKPKVYYTIHNYRFLCPSGTLFHDGRINLDSKTFLGFLKNVSRGVYQNSKFKTLILGLIYRANLFIGTFNRVDNFIFLTSFSRDIHMKWRPRLFSNNVLKPNFLATPAKFENTPKEIDLLFVGRFTEEKGIASIMELLLKNQQLNIHLVGDGPAFEAVEGRSKDVGHIKLHGNLDRDVILCLMQKTRFLIFPSIWYEGMPMTIIESFSNGTPVIAKNLGAMSSMVTHNKTGYLYENLKELDTILSTLNSIDAETRNLFSQNCFAEFRDKYSYGVGLKNLKKIIETR